MYNRVFFLIELSKIEHCPSGGITNWWHHPLYRGHSKDKKCPIE